MVSLLVLLASAAPPPSPTVEQAIARALKVEERFQDKVFRIQVSPNWLGEDGLWYRVQTGPSTEEWVWATAKGEVKRFATQEAMAKAMGGSAPASKPLRLFDRPEPGGAGERVDLIFENKTKEPIQIFWLNGDQRVPYGEIAAGARFVQSTFGGHAWEVRTKKGRSLGYITAPDLGGTVVVDGNPPEPLPSPAQAPPAEGRNWQLLVKGHNVWARAVADGREVQLTSDGKEGDSYRGTGFLWSPDGSRAVAYRTIPAQERKVHLISSSPRDQLQPKLITLDYPKPGDRLAVRKPVLLLPEEGKSVVLKNDLFPNPWSLPSLGTSAWGESVTWSPDSRRFFFAYNQRGHQVMRVLSADSATGEVKTLFEDAFPTFIHYSGKYFAQLLPKRNEILWMSERDGWNHLYLDDAEAGKVKRQLTKGRWVVKEVESFDEEAETLILKVGGRPPEVEPYYVHYVRLDLKTGSLTPLTQGHGTHRLIFSPEGSLYLDVWSRVDQPPVTELRRTKDGSLAARLEEGDLSRFTAAGLQPPTRFSAKGRDGKTDIYGVMWKPTHFNPSRKYPVIEQIYAGPHDFHVPKQWSATYGNAQQLAELGFIVVQIDGMGTDGRGKAFHDVAFKNLKDAGFPDRIAWMKALARKVPSMDLTRVGIYGGSAGGQNALAALLWHGDFYKAAASDCGCHDNRMDKIWWNEQWMSWPVDKSYEDSSNVVHAARLKGALLLTVGELDTNVDPASTMQVADALIRAGKRFDLIVFPGGGHGAGESLYGRKRRMEFFLRHLRNGVPDSGIMK